MMERWLGRYSEIAYALLRIVAGLMFAWSPELHVYGAIGRGFETPTFNELAYRPDGTAGLNFALRPSRSNNVELGVKGRGPASRWRTEWSAALFRTSTRDEIITQSNTGGRSTFRNAGATDRRGLELAWGAALAPAWQFQLSQTWLDARFRDGASAGNRIPGTAHSVLGAEIAWQPAQGWRAGVEARRSGKVYVNDANSEAAPSFTTLALHGGYVFDLRGWKLSATARIDNLLDRRYAGSVIVNEGNARFYEPAPGRSYALKVTGNYGF